MTSGQVLESAETRVVSSEISGIITYVNQLLPSPALQSDAVK